MPTPALTGTILIEQWTPPERERELTADELFSLLQHIEQRAADGLDFMQDALALGMSATRAINLRRLILGRVCSLLQRTYGAKNVQRFADSAQVGLSTVRQYEDVVTFYGFDRSLRVIDMPQVAYVHIRMAMGAPNADAAVSYLEDVSQYGLTERQLKRVMYGDESQDNPDDSNEEKPPKERKVMDIDRAVIVGIDPETGEFTARVGDDVLALETLLTAHIIIKVPETPPAPIAITAEAAAKSDGMTPVDPVKEIRRRRMAEAEALNYAD